MTTYNITATQFILISFFSCVQVRETIEKELGKPMSELFANFDNNPLATASVSCFAPK
jgi:hypothetical protein